MSVRRQTARHLLLACLLCLLSSALHAEGQETADWQTAVQQLFPSATRLVEKQGSPPVYQAFQLDQLLGYAFESTDYSSLQGFSGKPIRLLIGMTPHGVRSRPERQQTIAEQGIEGLEVAMQMIMLERC